MENGVKLLAGGNIVLIFFAVSVTPRSKNVYLLLLSLSPRKYFLMSISVPYGLVTEKFGGTAFL